MTLSRKLVPVFALLGSLSVAAAIVPKVEITSFVYVNNVGRVAELCGRVTGVDGMSVPTLVRVLVDPSTSNPGVYPVTVGRDGHFCVLVASYRGSASASIDSMGSASGSGVVTATAALER